MIPGKVIRGITKPRGLTKTASSSSDGPLSAVGTKTGSTGESLAEGKAAVFGVGARGTASESRSNKSIKTVKKTGVKHRAADSTSQNDGLSTRHDKFNEMLRGCLDELPVLPKSVVRIFISSTFTDTSTERNKLMKEVYPMLKEYCSTLGVDFQVVDMRWGITEDSQNDHSVEKLCLSEIAECQRHSLGPNFVCILGDKYGFQPIPTELPVDLYEMVKEESERLHQPLGYLLPRWYRCDYNADPPIYKLQPVRTHFPHFGDHGNGDECARDALAWKQTYTDLRSLLRSTADSLLQLGKIDASMWHKFYWSVTEQEVTAGILTVPAPRQHALCFHRTLNGLKDNPDDPVANRYINTLPTDTTSMGQNMLPSVVYSVVFQPEIDFKAADNLEKLALRTIPKVLGKSNCIKFNVPWNPGGLNAQKHVEHAKYVNSFCSTFVEKVVGLIDQAVENRQDFIKQTEYYSSPDEIAHHLTFCLMKCESFCGQLDLLDKIREYVTDPTRRKPFVIHAESGAGKTSVMAMAMKKLKTWMKSDQYIGVVRFLGTSSGSLNIYDVLFSVCGQLADVNGMIMEPVSYQNIKTLTQYLPRFLRQVSSAAKVPVVILLDSIDQLLPVGKPYTMKWLPLNLPPNIKIIVSTLTNDHDILKNVKSLQNDVSYYAEVPPLPENTVIQITNVHLKNKRRSLTDAQMSVIIKKFYSSPSPLYLHLLIEKAIKWTSYDIPTDSELRDTTKLAIMQLFEDVENKYGSCLIAAALGYITISLNGLSEIEIEDVLSTDDKVLNEVYIYHDPPVNGIVRIPSLLWARIHCELKPYLAERVSLGKSTLFWYHRQFIEAAREKYVDEASGPRLHANLLQIYIHELGLKRDVRLKHRNLLCREADRQISPQPLTVNNRRKLACIMYHLQHSASIITLAQAKQLAVCNFTFLFTKIVSSSVKSLIGEYQSYITCHEPDVELNVVCRFLQSLPLDIHSKSDFSVQMLARIRRDSKLPHINDMMDIAKQCIQSTGQPLLIPDGPCFVSEARSSKPETLYSVTGCQKISTLCSKLCCLVEDMDTGEAVYTITDCFNGNILRLPYNSIQYDIVKSTNDSICFLSSSGYILYNCTNHQSQNFDFQDNPKLNNVLNVDKLIFRCISDDCLLLALAMTRLVVVLNLKEHIVSGILDLEESFMLIDIGLCANNGIICTCGWDNKVMKIIIKDMNTNKQLDKDVSCSVDTSKICVTNSRKVVLLWHDKSQSEMTVFDFFLTKEHRMTAEGHLEHRDGEYFCFLSKDGITVLGTCGKRTTVSNIQARCVVIRSNKNLLIVGFLSGILGLYALSDGNFLMEMADCKSPVEECVISDTLLASRMKNSEVKVWELNEVEAVSEFKQSSNASQNIFADHRVVAFCLSSTKRELFTSTLNKIVVWSLDSQTSIRLFQTENEVDRLAFGESETIVAYSSLSQSVELYNSETGRIRTCQLPADIIAFCMSLDIKLLYLISQQDARLLVTLYDFREHRIFRQFLVQKGLNYVHIDVSLSLNSRYLVLRVQCTEDDKKTINHSLKKGGFLAQPHAYRFAAVDLSHDTGTLLHCYRQLTKIPSLGVCIAGYRDNTMMFTARRSVVFWDIPSGKCDQKMSKSAKLIMMYRPDWTGGDKCHGFTECLVQTKSAEYTVLGSEDGYVIVYNSETGVPVNKQAPDCKHIGAVTHVAVSPDNQWVVSACRRCDLKLWDTKTGSELFSMNLQEPVAAVNFSPDSQNVVALIGKLTLRPLIFSVYCGKTSNESLRV